ncbi:response regulator [Flavobacterium branchiophilum]|uniref:histidine kinase n=2 Tax=Flavobacterium branchiophilum TaxID=55197 RepID=A0A2H3KEC2_9FLAO|nr:response regulator [Flavobacterium branchiophilum]PDS26559.1 hybrid sensor histidine kinase/response regulator [Flavobacterium branchiophilum]
MKKEITFKNEIDNIFKHFVSYFPTSVVFYVVIAIVISAIDYYLGLKFVAKVNLICVIPTLFIIFYSIIKHKKLKISITQAIFVLIFIFINFTIVGVCYNVTYPYMNVWFLLFFFMVKPINFQKKAVYFYIFIIITVYAINTFEFLNLNDSIQEVNKNPQLVRDANIILILMSIVYIETVSRKVFDRHIDEILIEKNELAIYKSNQINIQQVKDTFFTTISHEMRTPLNAIKGISDLLVSKKLTQKEIEDYQKIMNYSSDHLLNLVNDVLDFSKINLGEFSLSHGQFDLEDNIQFVYNTNKNGAKEKKLNYTIERKSDLPKFVMGDAQRFNQVLMNLISNAIKFTKKGFVNIVYQGYYDPDKPKCYRLNLTITDSGMGISETNLAFIFDKYFRAKIAHSESGIGLGMFITKQIVDLMEGTITVESQVGIGTIFKLDIPFEFLETHDKDNFITQIDYDFLSNLNVLIAEDNKVNQIVLSKLLSNNLKNCKITIVDNGKLAIAELEKKPYDIVLLDIIMPIMNGLDATKHIRNMTNWDMQNVPIIAITANVWENNFKECYDVGVNDVITKPFEIDDVLGKISYLMKQKVFVKDEF